MRGLLSPPSPRNDESRYRGRTGAGRSSQKADLWRAMAQPKERMPSYQHQPCPVLCRHVCIAHMYVHTMYAGLDGSGIVERGPAMANASTVVLLSRPQRSRLSLCQTCM